MSESQLENALRESLQREAAPTDFAARVLAKTISAETAAAAASPKVHVMPRAKSWLQKPLTLALAAALAAIAIVPAVVFDYQRREEARGLKAKQDLMIALAITRDQFRQVKEKVHRTTNTSNPQ